MPLANLLVAGTLQCWPTRCPTAQSEQLRLPVSLGWAYHITFVSEIHCRPKKNHWELIRETIEHPSDLQRVMLCFDYRFALALLSHDTASDSRKITRAMGLNLSSGHTSPFFTFLISGRASK